MINVETKYGHVEYREPNCKEFNTVLKKLGATFSSIDKAVDLNDPEVVNKISEIIEKDFISSVNIEIDGIRYDKLEDVYNNKKAYLGVMIPLAGSFVKFFMEVFGVGTEAEDKKKE